MPNDFNAGWFQNAMAAMKDAEACKAEMIQPIPQLNQLPETTIRVHGVT
jgi:hypothetical protein